MFRQKQGRGHSVGWGWGRGVGHPSHAEDGTIKTVFYIILKAGVGENFVGWGGTIQWLIWRAGTIIKA